MAPTRIQVTLPYVTGLPEDVSVNTWHLVDSIPAGEVNLTLDAFAAFYNSLSDFYSSMVSRVLDACLIEAYDLADPEPRQAVWANRFSLFAPSTSNSLPLEVSLCTSIRASFVSGSPNSRRRGRAYIGPLSLEALASGGSGVVPRPTTTFVESLAEATEDLTVAVSEAGNALAVYSRVDQVARPVVAGWVDNEFDTQRRRQARASGRESWTVAL